MHRTSFASIAVLALASASHAATDLVANGGFESGNFTGWTALPDPLNFSAVVPNGTPATHSGSFAAWLGPPGATEYLSQTLATDAGDTYVLDYWLRHQPAGTGTVNAFEVNWGGNVLADQPNCTGTNLGSFDYTHCVFSGLAPTGSLTLLKFGFREDTDYFQLDDVAVRVVPEPAVAWLLGAGLALVLARGRRRG